MAECSGSLRHGEAYRLDASFVVVIACVDVVQRSLGLLKRFFGRRRLSQLDICLWFLFLLSRWMEEALNFARTHSMNRRLVVVVERRKLPFMPWKRIRTGNFAPKFPEATQSDDGQNFVVEATKSIPHSVFSIGIDKNPSSSTQVRVSY